MAYAEPRRSGGYAGMYRSGSRRLSAGIFTTKEDAVAAATLMEQYHRLAQAPVPKLSEHVRSWSRSERDLQTSTLRGYVQVLSDYVLPKVGTYPVTDLTRKEVEALLHDLTAEGLSAAQVRYVKNALGRALRPLVPETLATNPTHGIALKMPPTKEYDLLRPEEVKKIAAAMPNEGCSLLVAFLFGTGTRYGEATEVRVSDISTRTCQVRIARRVTRDPSISSRFIVLDGTKGGSDKARTIGLPDSLLDRLVSWIGEHDLGEGDLIFSERLLNPYRRVTSRRGSRRQVREVEPGESFTVGTRTFTHGTAYAYTKGGCRCTDCRDALYAYRQTLRRPTRRSTRRGKNDTGHLPNDVWKRIWKTAVENSGIGWYPRTHDLRHSYATHLLANGVSIYEVKTLMGHSLIDTTLRYLHRVEAEKSKARHVMGDLLG